MKPRSCLVAVLSLLVLMVAAVPPILGEWASLGGDYQRTGLSRDLGPTWGCVTWKFQTGGAVTGSVTVGSDGRVHVPCEDGRLYTLDKDGKPLWVLDVNTPLQSAASVAPDGSLYVGGHDGMLYAVAPDGTLLWTYATGGAIYSSPAIGPNGDIYVGSSDGILYALTPDGAELWRFATDGPGMLPAGAVFASPAVDAEGTIYIGGLYDPNLYALNPSDGTVRWVCSFPSADGEEGGWPFASPVIAENGMLYQTLLYDSRLYAIASDLGTILWSTDLSDPSVIGVRPGDPEPGANGWSEPVLGLDGMIYVSLDDPYLRAVGPDGSIQWVAKLGDVGGFTLTVDRNNLIYAAGDDGFVYVVDMFGQEVTRFELTGWPAFPVIAAEDTLILGDSKDYSMLDKAPTNFVWAISSRNCGE